METRTIPPNLHFREPIPDAPSLHNGSIVVVDKVTPFLGGLVAINSKGFSGANAHVILKANTSPSVDCLPRDKPELPRLVLMAGRTKDSFTNTLDRMELEGPYPDSAYALLNRVGQPSIKQFPYRGYALVPVDDSTATDVLKVVKRATPQKRPLWFAFTGMGCQWNGMARQMMQFDPFSRSIHNCHDALAPYGVDLIGLLINEDTQHESMASSLASITAIQVALVDVLRSIGIQPDGIVGHSIGEAGSAYADGCLTAEQAVLCPYWLGRCVELANLSKGAMAAVGLTWEMATKRCPPDVYPACHNAEDSVTVAGPSESVAKMVAELKNENIFAREVDTMNVAFHSKHVDTIVSALVSALRKTIPDPKPRSERWISSSIPKCRWNEPTTKLCSAEYKANNYVSPVLFREALEHVPDNAILIEVGPHCLLQPILRRALGAGVSCLGLMKRNVDNLEFFLASLGELHTMGVQMDLSPLYPPVPWPVPRGTPSIAHLVSWDHTESWTVAGWKDFPMAAQDISTCRATILAETGLSIQCGTVDDPGVFNNSVAEDFTSQRIVPQRITSCLPLMDSFLSKRYPVVASCAKIGRSSKSSNTDKRGLLQSVARILGIKGFSSMDMKSSLGDYGIDSMMNVKLQETLDQDYGLTLSMQQIRELTISELRGIVEGGADRTTGQDNRPMST